MDYEKKYKKAIEKIRNLLDEGDKKGYTIVTYKKDFESIFPELAESEDEKIMKEIAEFIYNTAFKPKDIKKKEKWLAWLEKQGERKTPQWMIDFLDSYRRKIGCSLDHDEARDVEGKILCIMQWLEKQGQIKESFISQHENRICKENDDSLTSEDEKVRKELIDAVQGLWDNDALPMPLSVKRKDEWISWLERQGDYANFRDKAQVGDRITKNEDGVLVNISQLEGVAKPSEKQGEQKASYTTIAKTGDGGINALVTRELPIDGCDNEQNPDDKVEPEFNVGDWIVQNGVNRNPVQITSFEEDKGVGIKVWFSNGTGTYTEFLKGYHKWTTQDIKDGDILATESIDNYTSSFVAIYKKPNEEDFDSYCFVGFDGIFYEGEEGHSMEDVYPATKEQRDLLFQKMHEAGYTFDFERKKLEKIQDEEYNDEGYGIDGLYHAQRILEKTIGKVDGYQSDDGILEHKCAITAVKKLYEHKPTNWSEEDEIILQGIWDEILANKHDAKECEWKTYDKFLNWLKSLRPQK